MKVAIELKWRCGGRSRTGRTKIIDFPCLPPVGTSIYIDDWEYYGEVAESKVEQIHWFERWPAVYCVVLSEIPVAGVEEKEFRKWLDDHGWQDLAYWETPEYRALDEPPNQTNTGGV